MHHVSSFIASSVTPPCITLAATRVHIEAGKIKRNNYTHRGTSALFKKGIMGNRFISRTARACTID
jgi:hypothetical protein